MTQLPISDSSTATALFPEYAGLYELIAPEFSGLTDEQLDWSSEQWGWAEWSARRQLSHMASLLYRWLMVRWGGVLFPNGEHGIAEAEHVTSADYDRALPKDRYWDLPVLLEKLKESIDLAQRVLAERNVGFLRANTLRYSLTPQWEIMIQAHPTGMRPDANPSQGEMTLEATFRHMYFEETTHLYNVQRLKRAQGLPTVVDVPEVGYWVQEGWDRSEAN